MPGIEAALQDRTLWLRWPAGQDDVALTLLPLEGARLYGQRDGRWYAWGRTLPDFDVPDTLRFQPLFQVVLPAPMQAQLATGFALEPASLRLVPDDTFRPAQALQCRLLAFLGWAENVPGCVLEHYRAAARGELLFVLGKKLPWFPDAERFWGQRVLVPSGFRPEPYVSETDLRAAVGVADTDLLVLRALRYELVRADNFTPLSLAALRLAAREVQA